MMDEEDRLLPISALQHLLFCERQCALIHIEQLWAENRQTAEGRRLHEKAHTGAPETRTGLRITRGLPLHSFRHGLFGFADVVEWDVPRKQAGRKEAIARQIRNLDPETRRLCKATPIEYKRGRPKKNDCDRVQLCAQALCLEEMLSIEVSEGHLFYGQQRRRATVQFDEPLRRRTIDAAERLHRLIESQVTPPAVYEKRCERCSLISLCLPKTGTLGRSVQRYLETMSQ